MFMEVFEKNLRHAESGLLIKKKHILAAHRGKAAIVKQEINLLSLSGRCYRPKKVLKCSTFYTKNRRFRNVVLFVRFFEIK